MGELDSPDRSDFVKGIGLPECAVVETQLGTSLAIFLPTRKQTSRYAAG
jgi:orotate phosphoribosyltransferase-like protein